MISKNDKIGQGVYKLQKKAVPPLKAGDYALTSSIVLEGVDYKQNLDAQILASSKGVNTGDKVTFTNPEIGFSIKAPRFALDPSLINSVYPMSGATGAYHTTLPHLVLNSKTLPWERQINTNNSNQWLALLLLTANEINAQNVQVKRIKGNELFVKGANLIVPDITLEKWQQKADETIKVVELPAALFNSICPQDKDLPYLAHARQVDTTEKEDTGINAKGWFSVLVCNRLPQQDKDNTVFLVSLEGHDISGKASASFIRLVVLHQWSFHAHGQTFEEIAGALTDKSNIKPLKIEPPKQPSEAAAVNAINYGYTPLTHQLRNGKKTVSWYRGPLVPVSIGIPQRYSYQSADQCLRFDADTGMFDISYSAAWQLGRLLALSNKGFVKSLSTWKSSWVKQKIMNWADSELKNAPVVAGDIDAQVREIETDEVLTDFLMELWTKK